MALVFVACCIAGAHGQVTNPDGFITASNWLVIGPFAHALGCANDGEDELLSNFTAPASIPCEYPDAGDEIEYDSFLAASVEYGGPLSESFLPFWRPFPAVAPDSTTVLSIFSQTRPSSVSVAMMACAPTSSAGSPPTLSTRALPRSTSSSA